MDAASFLALKRGLVAPCGNSSNQGLILQTSCLWGWCEEVGLKKQLLGTTMGISSTAGNLHGAQALGCSLLSTLCPGGFQAQASTAPSEFPSPTLQRWTPPAWRRQAKPGGRQIRSFRLLLGLPGSLDADLAWPHWECHRQRGGRRGPG